MSGVKSTCGGNWLSSDACLLLDWSGWAGGHHLALSLYPLLFLLPSPLFLCLTGKLTSQGQPSPRKAVCSFFKGDGSIFNQKRCITQTDEETFYWTEDQSCQFESHLNTGKSMTVLSGISGGAEATFASGHWNFISFLPTTLVQSKQMSCKHLHVTESRTWRLFSMFPRGENKQQREKGTSGTRRCKVRRWWLNNVSGNAGKSKFLRFCLEVG